MRELPWRVGQIGPNEGEHLAVMPNTMRFAVPSEYAFAQEASFLDHAARSGVRDVNLGLDSLKSALGDRPASDQPQRGRANTLPASLRKHGDRHRARAVGDDPERNQSDCAIARTVGDHERRTLAQRPGLAGIAERRSATADRDRLVVQPPLRFRIVTRCTDKRLVLRLAEAQHDVTVGQRSVGWRQLDPTTLAETASGQSFSPQSADALHVFRRQCAYGLAR